MNPSLEPMILTGDDIKTLRMRLGWSRSDLARRLCIHCETISLWEEGKTEIPQFHYSFFQLTAQYADGLADEVIASSLADTVLEQHGLLQIDTSELLQK